MTTGFRTRHGPTSAAARRAAGAGATCGLWTWAIALAAEPRAPHLPYAIVDTGQERGYGANAEIAYPRPSEAFFGQDAQYQGSPPSYRDNGDGTVSDLSTGLMWIRDPGAKMTHAGAVAEAGRCRVGGHADWRLPTIKELYSLIDFRGTDPNPQSASHDAPFIDATVFAFRYGNPSEGDRVIDSQFATCTLYRGTTMGGMKTMFGVNFADGRIKGYPAEKTTRGDTKKYFVLYVRGNPDYGRNRYRNNGNGTVTDQATGLTWQTADSGRGMNWRDALAYAESLSLAGHTDWRLPNAKELQSLVDYSRSPDATGSAAIDLMFTCTPIVNEAKQKDFPSYWTGTTHVRANGGGDTAVYVAFGRAMGFMRGRWMDVHGAGAQRSDPKDGDPADFAQGRGPQGDAIRILNHVRCVRGGVADLRAVGPVMQTPAAARTRPDARQTPPGSPSRRPRIPN